MKEKMEKKSKIFITGGSGMLGRALKQTLSENGFLCILSPTREELDLLQSDAVHEFIQKERPDYIFHLASLVYGLKGNMKNQLDSLINNTKIYANVLECITAEYKPKKIFFAGTVASYGYPYIQQPIVEDDLFFGLPHEGEYGYAMAKRHAYSYLKIGKDIHSVDFVYGLLTNLFGENDTFDTENGHVIPSLISKAVASLKCKEKNFEVWGNADSSRDFLYVKDAAKAIIYLMENGSGIYNISTGQEKSMMNLAKSISASLSNAVQPVWNKSQPIGISTRSVSNNKLKELGFFDYTDFDTAIEKTVSWYMGEKK
jgi:GDP-L-fucose synthase